MPGSVAIETDVAVLVLATKKRRAQNLRGDAAVSDAISAIPERGPAIWVTWNLADGRKACAALPERRRPHEFRCHIELGKQLSKLSLQDCDLARNKRVPVLGRGKFFVFAAAYHAAVVGGPHIKIRI